MSAYRSLAPYAPGAPGAPAPVHARPGETPPFQLADLIALILARRALIIKVTIATVLLALIVALVLPTIWSGQATVMLDQRRNNFTESSDVLSQLPSNEPATMQNQIQLLTSRELAGQVVDQLHLVDDPEFNDTLHSDSNSVLRDLTHALNPRNWFADDTSPSQSRQRDQVIDAFLKHISASAQGLSTAVTLTATSHDANKAAAMANALAQAYVDSQVKLKMQATQATTGWLNEKLDDLAGQLQSQEEAIQRYKAQNGLTDSSPGNSLVGQQLVGISSQIVAARSDLAEKEAIKTRIDQLTASGNPADVAQIVSSPLIISLRTQQAQLLRTEAQARTKYGPLHPKMQAIEAQKSDLEQKITQEVSRLGASAANDVTVARAHLASLESSLADTEKTANTENMARVQLQALQSNAASTRTQYEAYIQRLRQSQNADPVSMPDSRIISQAAVPISPSGPKRSLIVGASLPLGVLLGMLCALLLERLGPLMPVRVNGARRASLLGPSRTAPRPAPRQPPSHQPPWAAPMPPSTRAWNGPPILGEIDDTARLKAADFVIDYPASRYAHALTRLVHQLDSRGLGAAVVALTAADAGEHRAAVAASLARAASRMGKRAVIVDCAPGGLASRAIKARAKHGLYEVLTGHVTLNQALTKDPRGETYLLGCPHRPPNALTMFSSRQMTHLLSILRGGADFVVIDCGTANAGLEAAGLARLADATVLVARRQSLHGPGLTYAARALQDAQAAPIGIVVTR